MHSDLKFLAGVSHEILSCPAVSLLGEIHWRLSRAASAMDNACRKAQDATLGFQRYERTPFGEEVEGDEINWWIAKRESNIEELKVKTISVLAAVQVLTTAARALMRGPFPGSYDELLMNLKQFASNASGEIEILFMYILFLEERDPLAPSILYTYRVWGTTRRGDRRINIEHINATDKVFLGHSARVALGLWLKGNFVYDWSYLSLGQEIADSMDPEDPRQIVEVPVEAVLQRTTWDVYRECDVYFTEIRDSLRNILLDVDKAETRTSVLHNSIFWSEFIRKVATSTQIEPQLWDLKETLSIWHATGEGKRKARQELGEDVAAFANARGGVLVIGVTDAPRRIVGIPAGAELENQLHHLATTIKDKLDYNFDIVAIEQVVVEDGGATKLCLVVIVSQSRGAVAVAREDGSFSYPVRLATGRSHSSERQVTSSKIAVHRDNVDFLGELVRFVRSAAAH